MLNQALYQALKARFGEVRVSRPGMQMERVYRRTVDALSRDVRTILITPSGGSGEEYLVCCPFCGDRRFRLSINHRWGTFDEKVGRRLWHLAICYNENCLSNFRNRKQLWQMIKPYMRGAWISIPLAGRSKSVITGLPETGLSSRTDDGKKIEPPGQILGLEELQRVSRNHPALQYLRQRGFDPVRLWRVFRVGYVVESDNPLYADRIYVPVYQGGELRGWQLRAVHPYQEPRWYTMPGMNKSCLLYNADCGLRHSVKILVEGASSAWAVGKQAIACFGKQVSRQQWAMIADSMSDGDHLVIMLDPDPVPPPGNPHHIDMAFRQSQQYPALRGKVAVVRLPLGTDPADCDKSQLRERIMQAIGLA